MAKRSSKGAESKSKPTLVTGASGFLGLHLVDVLRAQGKAVRSFGRSEEPRLAERGVEQVLGSVLDADAVKAALLGVAEVYHLAGSVSRDKDNAGAMYAVHVQGTRHVLQAALDAGVARVLVVSTSGTVGVSDRERFTATERSSIPWKLIGKWPYYESKAYAENEIDSFIKKGLPVKIARPTLLLGPGDFKGSSTNDVVKFLCGDVMAALPGGMSAVDVRDVADVLPRLMDEGAPGVGYLLGAINCSVRDFLVRLEQVSGVRAPNFTLPRSLTDNKAVGRLLKGFSSMKPFGGLEPMTFEMGCHYWYIDSSRAQAELGFAPRDFGATLRDTVEDLRGIGRA